MKRLGFAFSMLASPALAHDGLLTHAHPHADYGLALFGVAALVAVGLLVAAPALNAARARKGGHDTR